VDRDDPVLPVVTRYRLLKIARSTLYYQAAPVDPDDLAVMRRTDELYLASPFYGSRRMVAVSRREGLVVKRERVRWLMRLEAIYQKPNTSQGHPDNEVYPYLLRGLVIDRPNQVWCADMTLDPLRGSSPDGQGICLGDAQKLLPQLDPLGPNICRSDGRAARFD
jgi:putative transposase